MMNDNLNNPPMPRKKAARIFEHWHMVALFLVLYDLAVVVGAYFIALWLRMTEQVKLLGFWRDVAELSVAI